MKKLIVKVMVFGVLLCSIELMAIATNSLVAPINMGIYNITDTSVHISFKDMSNNEEGFRISYLKGNKKISRNIQSSDLHGVGKYNYVTLTNLRPATLYQVSIVAYNKEGESSPLLKYTRTLPSKLIERNNPPTANAGEDRSMHFGTTLVLKGVGQDSDGVISSYLWEEGPMVLANTSVFSYTPSSIGNKKLTFSVIDDDGAKAQDSINIMVVNQNMVSINDFGAIPDDNKDDTEAIQRALDVNGHITMKKGVYNVHGLIRLNKETVIDGAGSTFLSVLDTSNNGRTSKNILTLSGDKITIKNLILDGAYTNGNAKEGNNVSSLLHIYDSNNVLLDGVNTVNHASNWWGKTFSFSQLNNNHKMDMYHVIYIGFSNNITIKNMEQLGNIKTEGILVYESDNILIKNFKSSHSPQIWTSLHVIASDNVTLDNVEVADGNLNQGGSSINFIANHHFLVKNTRTTTKQGFDISNEIRGNQLNSRVTRDTSYGVFDNCYFKGQRALYGYPTINKSKDLVFRNIQFIPTKEGYATWGVRIQKAGKIQFENCTFGSKKYKTYGMIMGDSDEIRIKNSTFINPSVAVYIFGKKFGTLTIEKSHFIGDNYTPVDLYWSKGGVLQKFLYSGNKVEGILVNNRIYNIKGSFKVDKIIEY